jgi:CheY-like chemotaxis protein
VVVEIEDHGEGIAASIIEHIFDPYFTTRPDGSGLGLTTAYSIVEKHGGRIEVYSEEGKGTTVSFYLPAAVRAASGKIAPPAEAVADGRRARVLVMDDDDAVRVLIAKMLGLLGHSAGVASNGREALDLYEKGIKNGTPWDIVIMDLTIPGEMGGKETIGPLLHLDPGAKVIVSSGYSNDDVLANFGTYGFRGRLAKPFTREDLARAINAVLGA